MVELPPNGQGIIALIILAIMERYNFSELDPIGAERAHLQLEACRIAYSVRDRVLSDPNYLPFDHVDLLDSKYIDQLVAKIDPTKRTHQVDQSSLMPKSDTIYLAVVDSEGRAVSLINSLLSGLRCRYLYRKNRYHVAKSWCLFHIGTRSSKLYCAK